MTPEELERIKALHLQATNTPWELKSCYCCSKITHADGTHILGLSYEGHPIDGNDTDAPLMVEARNALPGLLDQIDRLTKRLEILSQRLGRVARNHPAAYAQALADRSQ